MSKFTGLRVIVCWIVFLGILLLGISLLWDVKGDEQQENMTVYFLQTAGDADCTVLVQGERCIVIDTGEAQDGESIIAFLREKQITEISYLVLTHPDADHIGGAAAILQEFPVKNLIEPYYGKEKEALPEIYALCDKQNTRRIIPVKGRRFTVGSIVMSVYPPLERKYGNDNNYSLLIKIKHEQVEMIFTGDVMEKRAQELLHFNWQTADVYKVPYHGRTFEGTVNLLEIFKPKVAVVTAGRADDAVIQACDKIGTDLYCTGEGMVEIVSDGSAITVLE